MLEIISSFLKNMIKEEDTIRKIISEYFEGDDFNNVFKIWSIDLGFV